MANAGTDADMEKSLTRGKHANSKFTKHLRQDFTLNSGIDSLCQTKIMQK